MKNEIAKQKEKQGAREWMDDIQEMAVCHNALIKDFDIPDVLD